MASIKGRAVAFHTGIGTIVGGILGAAGFVFLGQANDAKQRAVEAGPDPYQVMILGMKTTREKEQYLQTAQNWQIGGGLLIGAGALLILICFMIWVSRNRQSPAGTMTFPAGSAGSTGAADTYPESFEPDRMFCPDCGESISVLARRCRFCGTHLPARG